MRIGVFGADENQERSDEAIRSTAEELLRFTRIDGAAAIVRPPPDQSSSAPSSSSRCIVSSRRSTSAGLPSSALF